MISFFYISTSNTANAFSIWRIQAAIRSVVVLQVLGYAQQSRESSNYEQASLIEKMQDYIRQIDYKSKLALNGSYASPNDVGMQPFNRKSHKEIEAVMQSAAKGKVMVEMTTFPF